MNGGACVQQGGKGQDMGDFAVINLTEVHAVHVGTHNDGARHCGPDPPVAYDPAHARGYDADRNLGTSCSNWLEDACGVADQAVGAGQSERHQSAGESSA